MPPALSTYAVCLCMKMKGSADQNRPLNSQNVADALQKYNLKKTAVQKALDALSDSGKISFKEYGKQRIYIARQDQFDIPNTEELDRMKKENLKLQEDLRRTRERLMNWFREFKKKNVQHDCHHTFVTEIRALQTNLTMEQIRAKEAKLRTEVEEMEEKLKALRDGVTLVRPEDRKAVEHFYQESITQWRRRKRMFKDVWDAITENSPKNLKEFKEELGIEYDEDVGASLQSFSELAPHGKRQKR
ncbi:hypothetical protein Syun_021687 [Stephania yunnanensis]|uniref:Homologous-pairing protein 2 homolog n=1 Tax=Stephania yunnanensis TaxID=152371 RepID=A0AAP0IGI5_9MAGN